MKTSINKVKLTSTIVLILLMASVTLIVNVPIKPVQAQLSAQLGETQAVPAGVTPFWTQPTVSYISIRDNVIGLGQQQVINVWVSPSLETNRRYMNNITKAFVITLTKPDGSKVVLYAGNANSEGTEWEPYVVDQVGEWKAKFDFKGTYFPQQTVETTVSFGAAAGTILRSLFMQPSSTAEYSFFVQQDMMQSWPPSPLPTDYWTWPVDIHNREWWQITGPWPATGYNAGSYASYFDTIYPGTNPYDIPVSMFTPFVAGPNSAHVLRTDKRLIGGLIGGAAGITSYLADDGFPSVVYKGRCYKTVTKVMPVLQNGTYRQLPVSVAECFDLRTGQVYYDIPTADGGVTPTMVVYDQGTQTQSDVPTYSAELISYTGGRLYKINANTGAVTTNVTTSPITSGTLVSAIEEVWLSVQDLGSNATDLPGGRYRLINWTSVGSSSDFAARIYSNTTYARSSLPTYIDWTVGLGATVSGYDVDGVRQGQNCSGFNVLTGEKLWSKNVTEPAYSSINIADHGKLAILSMYGFFITMDLRTGNEVWRSPKMNYPFGASAFGVYGIASAYGLLFRPSYDGLYAFNWSTGLIQWFAPRHAKAFDESTYTEFAGGPAVYPGQTQVRIADGKVYIYDGEHSPNQPITRGWSLYCFDVYTGEKMWEFAIGGAIMFSTPPSTGPIVDGYLYFPSTDGVTYIIGIGQSATTVNAPDVSVPLGTSFTIKGSVLDQSPAQPGTPCVDDGESMTTQMNYLHLQYPITGIYGNLTITGVPVSLSATGSDGTYYDLGTVTTNGYYGTFSKAWTPPKEDTYTIMATFMGSKSYGTSSAANAVTVGPAPAPYPTQEPTQGAADNTGLLYATLAAVIIAIVIGIVAVLLALRKH